MGRSRFSRSPPSLSIEEATRRLETMNKELEEWDRQVQVMLAETQPPPVKLSTVEEIIARLAKTPSPWEKKPGS